jgi:hypothetical protein
LLVDSLWLRSPFYTASCRRQRFVRRGLAVTEFDVATAAVDVIFFVDGRRLRSGGDLFSRFFALGLACPFAPGFRLACTFRQFSLPDIKEEHNIEENVERNMSVPWSLLEQGLIWELMIVATAMRVNARLI